MKNDENRCSSVQDRINYLNHEIRRPISNLTSICELLKASKTSAMDFDQLLNLLQASLEDFDSVMSKYEDGQSQNK